MNRIKNLIKNDNATWAEIKKVANDKIVSELGKPYRELGDKDSVFAQANYRNGLAKILELLEIIEKEALYEKKRTKIN